MTIKTSLSAAHQLAERFNDGRLRLPDFQRDYVWTTSRQAQFFDALYQGMPVGTLLIWNKGPKRNEQGETTKPESESTANCEGMLLDGQQRLTTLNRAISGHNEEPGKVLYFDYENEKTVIKNNAKDKVNPLKIMRISDILCPDSKDYKLKIRDFIKSLESDQRKIAKGRIDGFRSNVREYPFVSIVISNIDHWLTYGHPISWLNIWSPNK